MGIWVCVERIAIPPNVVHLDRARETAVAALARRASVARASTRTVDMANLHSIQARVLEFEAACQLQAHVRTH